MKVNIPSASEIRKTAQRLLQKVRPLLHSKRRRLIQKRTKFIKTTLKKSPERSRIPMETPTIPQDQVEEQKIIE